MDINTGDRKNWSKLDNVAKIFPPTTTTRDTNVFRFICRLHEPVDAGALKKALDSTLGQFPLYRSTLKKGMFWYYFEHSDIQPEITQEDIPVCSPLYNADKPALLFRVHYYGCRINLEVYHALADGSGAISFLRVLIDNYLAEKYDFHNAPADDVILPEQKQKNDFKEYFDKKGKVTKATHSSAYRVRGERMPDNRKCVIEGFMPVRSVLGKAKENKATLSEFLITLLISAIGRNQRAKHSRKPVIITVPVDLRQYFPSKTACNFFAIIRIEHSFRKDGDSFDEILSNVRSSLRRQLTRENMNGIINRYAKVENNLLIKAVPLFIKIPFLALSGMRARIEDTAVFSNTGIITMPEGSEKYIHRFSVCIDPKRPQFCLCTYGDTLAVTVSSPYTDTSIQREFFRSLTAIGIDVQIVSNMEQTYRKQAKNA